MAEGVQRFRVTSPKSLFGTNNALNFCDYFVSLYNDCFCLTLPLDLSAPAARQYRHRRRDGTSEGGGCFIVVIIGGLGSLPGTVIAALLIGMSDGVISVFFSPTLAKILATLFVAMVLVFRPQGLFGAKP